MRIYRTSSSRETKKLGYKAAKRLLTHKARSAKRRHAVVLALSGELGSGKTTFAQGFLSGFGIKKRSASPTFIIFRKFIVHGSWFKNAYHVDAYRIKKPRELGALGFGEILSDPRNIILIEWADQIKEILPGDSIWLKFHHGRRESERKISVGGK